MGLHEQSKAEMGILTSTGLFCFVNFYAHKDVVEKTVGSSSEVVPCKIAGKEINLIWNPDSQLLYDQPTLQIGDRMLFGDVLIAGPVKDGFYTECPLKKKEVLNIRREVLLHDYKNHPEG